MSQLWKELHERAASFAGTDDKQFVSAWGAKLPRFTQGCSCNEFWKNWVAVNPPVFVPQSAYFEWTIKAHNAVNTKLKKKIWTVPEAREAWPPGSRTVIALPNSIVEPVTKPITELIPKPIALPEPIRPVIKRPIMSEKVIRPIIMPEPVKIVAMSEPVKVVAMPEPVKTVSMPRGMHNRYFPQRAIAQRAIVNKPQAQNQTTTIPRAWMIPKQQAPSINQSHPTFKRWTLTPEQMAKLEQQKKNAIKKSE